MYQLMLKLNKFYVVLCNVMISTALIELNLLCLIMLVTPITAFRCMVSNDHFYQIPYSLIK